MLDSFARRIFAGVLHRLRGGTLELVEASSPSAGGPSPAGSSRFFGDGRPLPGSEPIDARVVVHDPRLYARLLRDGSVGLGEAYAERWWDTDDLAGFLRLAHRNLARTHAWRDRMARRTRPFRDPISRLHAADQTRDRENIHAHYDVGNDLFRRVLDETMMYSCAVFESPDDSLETASLRKLDRLATMLHLAPGDRVLEIGTGWGGFAVHAARRYGCHVTTTTISEQQYEYARNRVHAAGLDGLVTVRFDDYRDLQGTFDKAIAIEMIEAVDWREYESFFTHARRLLTDSGLLVMQAIVVPDASFDRTKHHTDFIKAEIFPGGCLPSVGALTTAANVAGGFGLVHLDDIGADYAETLRRWRANLVSRRDDLAPLGFDDRFTRLWEFYFAYCEAGFDERYISVEQLAYATPGWRAEPTWAHARPAVSSLVGMSDAARVSDDDLSLQEAADALGVHYMTAYRYVRTGRLPAVQVDGKWRVRKPDLERMGKPRAPGRTGRGVTPSRVQDQQRLCERLVRGDEIEAWRLMQQLLVTSASPEDLYLDVLGPALHMVGDAWAAGTISVAEEHRASAVMYRLVGRLGPLFVRRGRTRGDVVLGAPSGDYHGLATAFVADVLRGRRLGVIDLGGSTPAESFVEAVASTERLVGVGIVASAPDAVASLSGTLRAIKDATDQPVLLGGVAISSGEHARAPGADGWTRSARDAVDWFDDLAR